MGTIWIIPVVLRALNSYVVEPILTKRMTHKPSRARSLVWTYLVAALIMLSIGIVTQTDFLVPGMVMVLIIGALNAFAAYSKWRAFAISLSKTSLFTQADDLIAMGLGYAVLGEGRILSPLIGAGILVILGSAFLFQYVRARDKGILLDNSGKADRLWKWIAIYSVIWGVANFSQRYFSLKGMSLIAYIGGWYGGSLVGALIVYALSSRQERGPSLSREQIRGTALLAAVFVCGQMLGYWARSLAPLLVVEPFFQLAEMFFPLAAAFWIFKEHQSLNRAEKFAIAVGLVGGVMIVFGYS